MARKKKIEHHSPSAEHAQHPSFKLGMKAYSDGVNRERNPYKLGHPKYLLWSSGWAYARVLQSPVRDKYSNRDGIR